VVGRDDSYSSVYPLEYLGSVQEEIYPGLIAAGEGALQKRFGELF